MIKKYHPLSIHLYLKCHCQTLRSPMKVVLSGGWDVYWVGPFSCDFSSTWGLVFPPKLPPRPIIPPPLLGHFLWGGVVPLHINFFQIMALHLFQQIWINYHSMHSHSCKKSLPLCISSYPRSIPVIVNPYLLLILIILVIITLGAENSKIKPLFFSPTGLAGKSSLLSSRLTISMMNRTNTHVFNLLSTVDIQEARFAYTNIMC